MDKHGRRWVDNRAYLPVELACVVLKAERGDELLPRRSLKRELKVTLIATVDG